jgi:hypothetical protein
VVNLLYIRQGGDIYLPTNVPSKREACLEYDIVGLCIWMSNEDRYS